MVPDLACRTTPPIPPAVLTAGAKCWRGRITTDLRVSRTVPLSSREPGLLTLVLLGKWTLRWPSKVGPGRRRQVKPVKSFLNPLCHKVANPNHGDLAASLRATGVDTVTRTKMLLS